MTQEIVCSGCGSTYGMHIHKAIAKGVRSKLVSVEFDWLGYQEKQLDANPNRGFVTLFYCNCEQCDAVTVVKVGFHKGTVYVSQYRLSDESFDRSSPSDIWRS